MLSSSIFIYCCKGADVQSNPIVIRVAEAQDINAAFAAQITRLASQLRGQTVQVSEDWLREIIAFPKTWMLLAQAEEEIVGMLTLHAFPRTGGWTPWIEGVVVEENRRGQGIGRALLQKAVAIAEEQGFEIINLSSRPHRGAANVLYESLGFEVVQTNYRRKRLK